MKRRNFINLALFLPVLNSLKTVFTEKELLRFHQTDLEPLLKFISPANKATATLMMKNLLFDVQYMLTRTKDLKDAGALKNLAMEADKKFYEENKLSASLFLYQPITLTALEGLRIKTSAKPEVFEAMMKSLTNALATIKESKEGIASILVTKITSLEAIEEVQKAQATKAQQAQECARNWSLVGSIVVCVIVIIIAIIVSAFTFGVVSSNQTSSTILSAALAAIIGGGISAIVLTPGNLSLGKTNISLEPAKVDFSKVDLDKLLKCSISSVAIASAISAFGTTTYPAKPIAGSIALNLLAITKKIPGIETVCW